MATYMERKKIQIDRYTSMQFYGYYPIPIYGQKERCIEIEKWISINVSGNWTSYLFINLVRKGDRPKGSGYSYCFNNKEDAMAFKLRWF